LVAGGLFSRIDEPRLNPGFTILGQAVILDPLQIVSVDRQMLGPVIASLADQGDAIVAAIDIVITQVHG
jgi:hypothetical protein